MARRRRTYSEQATRKRREYTRIWREKNKLRVLKYSRDYYRAKLSTIKEKALQYRGAHKEHIREYNARYRVENPDKLKLLAKNKKPYRLWGKTRKLVHLRRARRTELFKKKHAGGSAVRDLGCSVSVWEQWLESKFRDGMTWENHGPVWHLDEIIPCAAWNLEDPTHWAACWHWTNSQPLLAHENLTKSSRATPYVKSIDERLMVLRALDILPNE